MIKKAVIKFLIAGGSAAAVEYAIFIFLNTFYTPLIIANTISFLCGLTVSFTLNKFWVFLSNGKIKRQFLFYVILGVVNVCVGNGLIWLLVNQLELGPLLAKFIIMIMIALWNYFFFSRIIFK